jgi:hypothetical protein
MKNDKRKRGGPQLFAGDRRNRDGRRMAFGISGNTDSEKGSILFSNEGD